MVVVGLGLFDLSLWWVLLRYVFLPLGWGITSVEAIPPIMITFGMGASSAALFARLGGGIFTKAADVGADLVGKIEAGIPEDDPRNPATIADNVGDNVGDVAGMGADLYESYVGSVVATMALGSAAASLMGLGEKALTFIQLPAFIAVIGVIASIIGTFFVHAKEDASQKTLLRALRTGVWSSTGHDRRGLVLHYLLPAPRPAGPLGLGHGRSRGGRHHLVRHRIFHVRLVQADEKPGAEHYHRTGHPHHRRPVPRHALHRHPGRHRGARHPRRLLLRGRQRFPHYRPLRHRPGRRRHALHPGDHPRHRRLRPGRGQRRRHRRDDPPGARSAQAHGRPRLARNTTAATGKGFAIGSAALTALALIAEYGDKIAVFRGLKFDNIVANILDPVVLIGLMLGVTLPFVFSAMAMGAVGRAAQAMVNEVRRQFKATPGILKGTDKPDYASCVRISTIGAQREMVIPRS